MSWYNAATRGTETSYILITREQSVEMPMFSVPSLYKSIPVKNYVTEINKIITLLRLQYVDFR